MSRSRQHKAAMGFAQTAAFFEARAGRARDPDDRQRLLDVAGFYRKLARITPGFPPGCKAHDSKGGANAWKARADECRAIADHLSNPNSRAPMMRLAETYDALGVAAE